MPDYLDDVGTQLAQLTARGVDRSTGPTLIREPQRHSGRGDGGPGGGKRRSRERCVFAGAVAGVLALGLGANDNHTPTHPAATTQHHPTHSPRRHRGAPRTSTAANLSSK